MKISTSKSEYMVLSWKRVECPLQVGDEVLTQVQEFNLFTRDDKSVRCTSGSAQNLLVMQYSFWLHLPPKTSTSFFKSCAVSVISIHIHTLCANVNVWWTSFQLALHWLSFFFFFLVDCGLQYGAAAASPSAGFRDPWDQLETCTLLPIHPAGIQPFCATQFER